MAKLLEIQRQHQSFQWIFRIDFLENWLVWSPCWPRDSQESSSTQFKNISSSELSLLDGTTLTSVHDYWQNHSFDFMDLCWQSDALLFNILSRFVIVFLPRSNHRLISWLQSPSILILEPKKVKSVTVSIFSPSIFHEVMEPNAMILVFWMLSFKPAFSLYFSTIIKRLFSSSLLSPFREVSSLNCGVGEDS